MRNLILLLAILALASFNTKGQKITADELVARNLDSIIAGTERSKLRNIVAIGQAAFSQTVGDKTGTQGKVVIASEANRAALAMAFQASNYPQEKIVFDGKDTTIAFTTPGVRSSFGNFVHSFPDIIGDGLLGGTLVRTWLLYGIAESNKGKLIVEGLKKIDGRDVYAVGYNRKGGSDIAIRLYFDKETFRHVRTEYKRTIAAPMGRTPELSARQSETQIGMVEEFDDFKTENGITLPRSYTIRLRIDNGRSTNEYSYKFSLNDLYYNQDLDADTFSSK